MSEYDDIIQKRKKLWACPDLMESVNKNCGKKISFSSPSLNWATRGGVPRAALSVFYGTPGGGKSTTSIDLCKNAYDLFSAEYAQDFQELQEKVAKGKKEYKIQLADLEERGVKRILYIDLEHTFDKRWAAKMHVHTENGMIDVMQPPNITAESLLQTVRELISTGQVGLIIIDSVPSLVTQSELEKELDDKKQAFAASLAGLMTKFLRIITPLLPRYDCTLILINQLRTNQDNPYADKTPGGDAILFYSSLILSFRLGSPVDFLGNEVPLKTENPAGYKIEVVIKKQKSAAFDRKKGTYYLMAQSGLRVDFEYADLAITKYNIIVKSRGWYTICDPITKEPLENGDKIVNVNGLANVYDYLQINTEYYDKLCKFIIDDINRDGETEEVAISEEEELNEQ